MPECPLLAHSSHWVDRRGKTAFDPKELDSWLRAKLGHETSLTGEVVRIGGGLTLTARTAEGAVSVKGSEADMDALTARLAESIYRLTQPYRYAIYLMRQRASGSTDAAPKSSRSR